MWEELKSKGIKSYYQDDSVFIIHDDCKNVLPLLPDKYIDLCLTDPPYPNQSGGLSYEPNDPTARSRTVGDLWLADLSWITEVWRITAKGMLIFSGILGIPLMAKALPNEGYKGLVTWHKRNAPNSVRNVPQYDCEYVWLYQKQSGLNWRKISCLLDTPSLVAGYHAKERMVDITGMATHPCQKPEEVINALLIIGGDIILDPFLGSGTTAFCAKKLGRKCIGIEIEEKYCEIAAKRCSQSVMSLNTEPVLVEEQEEFHYDDNLPPNP